MTNQRSINGILTAALQEIRAQHGLAVRTVRTEWLDTIDQPFIAITRIEVEGSVNDAMLKAREET